MKTIKGAVETSVENRNCQLYSACAGISFLERVKPTLASDEVDFSTPALTQGVNQQIHSSE